MSVEVSGIFEKVIAYAPVAGMALLILVVSLVLSSGVRMLAERLLRRVMPRYAGFVAMGLQFGVLLLGLVVAVQVTGASTAVVLTVIAIVSAGVSLALDKSAQDAIAGIKLLFFGTVRMGDYVRLGEYYGRVVAMDLFTVTLQTRSRDAIVIPNGQVSGRVIVNSSLVKGQAVDVMVPLLRPYDLAVAMQMFGDVAAAVDVQYGHSVFDPSVRLRELGAADVWRVRVYVDDEVSDSAVKHDLLMGLSAAIEGVGLPVGSVCCCGQVGKRD